MPSPTPRRLAPIALLALCLGAPTVFAQAPRCAPGRSLVELQQGPGTPMVPYRVRVTRRCLSRAQIARLRGPYACHPADRRGVITCVALVPRMAPRPDRPAPGSDR